MMNPDTPNEAPGPDILTEDKVVLHQGDRAFNYYDMKAGTIDSTRSYAQPDPSKGQNSSTPIDEWSNYWFTFRHDDGTSTSLDGSRICSIRFAERKGWL